MTFNPDTLAKEIIKAVRKEEEERIRIGLNTALNIERLKKMGVYDKKEERKTDINKKSEFNVITAMDDMRARVLTGMIENFLSKIIPKKFRKKQEIGSNIHEMDKRE